MSDKKTVSLVLGSGAARGLAHIGVINVLESQGFKINAISGCSMGALIGGLYAAGGLDDFTALAKSFKRIDFIKYLDLSLFSQPGVLKGDVIIETLKNIVGETSIEDLPIPYTAVATDIDSGKEVWIEKGCLFDAIRASISIPGIFTPYHYHNRLLVDGAVLNPVPVLPMSDDISDYVVAVDVNGPVAMNPHGETSETNSSQIDIYRKKIDDFLLSLKDSFDITPGKEEEKISMTDVLLKSFESMQSTITRYKLAGNMPDLLITIPKNVAEVHEFYRASQLIKAGEWWTERALETSKISC